MIAHARTQAHAIQCSALHVERNVPFHLLVYTTRLECELERSSIMNAWRAFAKRSDDDVFKKLFASFVARKFRSGRATSPPPETLRRSASDYHLQSGPRWGRIGVSGFARESGGLHAHSHHAGAGADVGEREKEVLHTQSRLRRPSRGMKASPEPSNTATEIVATLEESRKYARKTLKSEKSVSTQDGRPPRKRSRTHEMGRSQSANAISVGGASTKGFGRGGSSDPRERSSRASRDHQQRRGTPQKRTFPCSMCDSVFAQRGQLSRHIRRVHEKLRPHVCDFCGRPFGARSDRTRHIQLVHNKVRDFACEICGFKFQARTHLEAHVRTVHDRERPFKCEQCGSSFGLRSNLLTHERTVHLKIATWRCTVCGKAFNRKHDQRRHMKLVHNVEAVANNVNATYIPGVANTNPFNRPPM